MYEFTCHDCGDIFYVENQDEIFHCWKCKHPLCFSCYYLGEEGYCVECSYEQIPNEQR